MRRPAFTRFNVFLRDRFTCQYCGNGFPANNLTFDHVVPRSRGGRTTWENVVTACAECNMVKSNRLPKAVNMKPIYPPVEPTTHQRQERGRGYPPHHLHVSWRDFLDWDPELQP